jgi:hypothetical protein
MAVFSLQEVKIEQVKNILNDDFVSWPESSVYGYYVGGAFTATMFRLNFSTETFSVPGSNLPGVRQAFGSFPSPLYGYTGGGQTAPGLSVTATVSRFNFSGETFSNPGLNLPAARAYLAGTSHTKQYGYFACGLTSAGAFVATNTRLDFRTGVVSASTNFPTALNENGAFSGELYGYFGGGSTAPTTYVAAVQRLNFSTETINTTTSLPSVRDSLHQGVSNRVYGYFAGGWTGAYISNISRFDLSTETFNNPGNNLSPVRGFISMTSNFTYAYLGGGADVPGGTTSFVDRLDFSNDTLTRPVNLPAARSASGGISGGQSV